MHYKLDFWGELCYDILSRMRLDDRLRDEARARVGLQGEAMTFGVNHASGLIGKK